LTKRSAIVCRRDVSIESPSKEKSASVLDLKLQKKCEIEQKFTMNFCIR
jgi:hypothetical protein